jgi:hypothetical protein
LRWDRWNKVRKVRDMVEMKGKTEMEFVSLVLHPDDLPTPLYLA